MKTKTLNNLSKEGKYFDKEAMLVSEVALKQEAIKWVKKDKEDLFDEDFNDNLCGEDVLERWMKRLNITEEDLK